MAIPSGFTPLAYVGFTDKGVYINNATYVINDIVDYRGEKWKCKITNTIGVTPGENANWTLWIGAPVNLVERIIAPLEENPATIAYGVGRQIIWDDWLWEVIAPIEVGDTLVDYAVDPTNANIKKSDPVETQLLAIKNGLGTAASKDVPASGNASTTQVVMGNDTRLTDARNAADVAAWAKASSKPVYSASEISYGTGSNVGSEIQALANSKAPTSHASTGTEYGAGNASNYGHVKVSDNYTSSAGNASQSVAASSKAVNDAYTALTQTLTTKVNTSDIANNLTTTAEGKVLDARQGKALGDLNTVVSITADKGFSNSIVVNAKRWGKLVVVSGWLLLEADTYTDAKPVLVIPNIRPWGNSYGLAISTDGTKTVRLYPLDRNSRTEMVLDGSPILSERTRFYFNMTYVSQ